MIPTILWLIACVLCFIAGWTLRYDFEMGKTAQWIAERQTRRLTDETAVCDYLQANGPTSLDDLIAQLELGAGRVFDHQGRSAVRKAVIRLEAEGIIMGYAADITHPDIIVYWFIGHDETTIAGDDDAGTGVAGLSD